ncbi:phage virion morphogenesis protein [Paracoccus pantotrophus]|uniref:phage virion morphogenesis protein n=1 Tax=Paracoccus pantotrophus TaxID=82367 RepID=UPI0004AEC2AA|nr:phage virion morphogenesis protein [Paracoccus pantotrophus]
MTGISFRAELDATEAQNRLHQLVKLMDQRRPFFAAVGEQLVFSTGRNFQQQSAPDGTPWAPLKPATIKARSRRSRSKIAILRERGLLAGSINYQATDDEVRIGSPVEYAAVHQLGGEIEKQERAGKIFRSKGKDGKIGRRFVKKSKANVVTDVTIGAHAINIPARPFLGISPADEAEIFDLARRWLGL